MKACFFALGWGLVLIGSGAHGRAQSSGTVEGTVKLPPPPPATRLNPRYQAQAGALLPPEPPTAVVFLEGAPLPANEAAVTNVIRMVQQGMQFGPGLMAIRTGTRVEFPNLDGFYHNVFSYSKARRFDLGRYLKDEKPPAVTFEQAGIVKLYCEIHEHMRGTIMVLDTPYFTKTDTNGAYRLTGLPAGLFKLRAWVDEKTVHEKNVELKPGATLNVHFPVP